MEHEKCDECGCGHGHDVCEECGKEQCECEEMELQETVDQNDLILNAVVELLIEKGVITQEEFDKKTEELEKLWYEDGE